MRWYFGERAVHVISAGGACPASLQHLCSNALWEDADGFSPPSGCCVLSLLMACAAGEFGWPTSSILNRVPETDEEKTQLIDTLQDWKTLKYQEIVCELTFPPSAAYPGAAILSTQTCG